jgi:hypothetical protein
VEECENAERFRVATRCECRTYEEIRLGVGTGVGKTANDGVWIENAVTHPLHENLDTWTDSGGSPPIAISTNSLRSTPSLSPGTTVPGFCLPMDLVW